MIRIKIKIERITFIAVCILFVSCWNLNSHIYEDFQKRLFTCNPRIVETGQWDEGYGMKGDGYIITRYEIQFDGLPCGLDSCVNDKYGEWKYGNLDSLYSQDYRLAVTIFNYQLSGKEIKFTLGELRDHLQQRHLYYKTWSANDQKFEIYVYDPKKKILCFVSVWM